MSQEKLEVGTSYSPNKVQILQEETLWESFLHLKSITYQHQRFDGTLSAPQTRELLQAREAVVVLPYDPKNQTVVLIEQCRTGALHSDQPWLWECVAGMRDKPHEDLTDLAIRELQEEAGLSPLTIKKVLEYWSSPGSTSEKIHLFLAEVDSTQAPKFAGLASEGEDIAIHVFPLGELRQLTTHPKACNGATLIALQWLLLELS